MELYPRDLALFVHIAAAAVLIGTSVVTPFIGKRVSSASTRAELLGWLDSLRLLTRANPIVALLLLASGIYLVAAGWWSQGWFAVSVVAWVMSAALAGGVLKPATMKIAAAAAANGAAPIDAELERLRGARGWHVAEYALLASDAAILWIMIAKPDLVPSIVILAVAVAGASLAGGTMQPRLSSTA
jgi:uncharacterized membrane protein